MNVNTSFPVESETSQRRPAISDWLKKRRWFLIFVLGPTLLAALYYGLIASDVYVSESRFVIKSPDEKRSQMSTLANLVQTTGLSGGQEQTNEVLTFVRSRDALRQLERVTDVRAKFASDNADALARWPTPFGSNSFESLFKYYGKRVEATFDSEGGTALIRVEAFAPRDAYEINLRLLDLSEALVNRLNDRAQETAITEAQSQVELASARARTARIALSQYRNSQSLIDPTRQAAGVLAIADTLIAERAGLQAQLETMQRITPQNPSIPTLRRRIQSLNGQIASQDSRVVGGQGGIASKLGGYEDLIVEQEFATQSLNAASAALVQARAEAQRQKFYLERVVDPNVPDEPMLPKRLLSVIVVLACALSLYFIGWMFMIGVLEHAPKD
ncbi:capsule biosynthesis protein [Croceibacterium mercuriale]|uniref:Capsule biosynthesis protein n=1 Tax=Croceibacterium mercuriale TaxID=1572751 RepID=A0A0B2C2L1_9SPHN|nr:capsule biosynthesis protein [Croceibacterium mercuriale]KHL26497.1 capsule biosynthesis protein [Croceibacterium mercuriale]